MGTIMDEENMYRMHVDANQCLRQYPVVDIECCLNLALKTLNRLNDLRRAF
ncbi:MAG: hypothetical protein VX500_12600 [Planctomycetota bacterium]|nr:hypothetical protein [Planctomycetota bacterium]MEC8508431.1 hypothetical protein [Planctomycetota bacterium]